ncbi:LOW QUALITY PROTEIN: hypothetical protein T265_12828 [Opisthorchis viverrini]|uniref:C2H2-type domain-containing protein n=1 Tax=Opisthorchis viverrini TaxID=6198 RepID=A0A074ZXU3_OPIVI|nr:LOW QUALITY PROTEIN: hypothetical protein T265_12828 [Opisthorchis viverrini]KER32248.1 LOW QUALITY PROTEIN: hypothetical protein T265_12828 [Opisthorchis viverrini]
MDLCPVRLGSRSWPKPTKQNDHPAALKRAILLRVTDRRTNRSIQPGIEQTNQITQKKVTFPRNLQINLVFSGDSIESLVYDVLQLIVLHTDRLMIQLARYSRYRPLESTRQWLMTLVDIDKLRKGADRTAARIGVKNKLRGSGYPASLIRRQLRRVLVPVAKPNRAWIGTAVIPYIPGTSDVIPRILNTANIRLYRGGTLRSALVQLKDLLPANRTRDCFYKIKCNDCTKVYIGQTVSELHIRVGGHSRKINTLP